MLKLPAQFSFPPCIKISFDMHREAKFKWQLPIAIFDYFTHKSASQNFIVHLGRQLSLGVFWGFQVQIPPQTAKFFYWLNHPFWLFWTYFINKVIMKYALKRSLHFVALPQSWTSNIWMGVWSSTTELNFQESFGRKKLLFLNLIVIRRLVGKLVNKNLCCKSRAFWR